MGLSLLAYAQPVIQRTHQQHTPDTLHHVMVLCMLGKDASLQERQQERQHASRYVSYLTSAMHEKPNSTGARSADVDGRAVRPSHQRIHTEVHAGHQLASPHTPGATADINTPICNRNITLKSPQLTHKQHCPASLSTGPAVHKLHTVTSNGCRCSQLLLSAAVDAPQTSS